MRVIGYRRQRTLAGNATVEGVGFVTGTRVRVRLRPAAADTGIVFHRTDHPGARPIPARAAFVTDTRRRTTLGPPGCGVTLVEHLLSALAGLRIDNCEIDIDGPEPPGLDGSADGYVAAVAGAGAALQNARRPVWAVDSPVVLSAGGATIALHPSPDAELRASYLLDYGATGPIPRQRFTLGVRPGEYARGVATSRTFLTEPEADGLRAQGVGRHLTAADLLVFGPRGPINNRLRFADEPARHKVLDMIGDLALCGFDLAGHVVAYRSGHALNVELARTLAARAADSSGRRAASRTGPDDLNSGERMTRLRTAVIGVGHLGQHHARILAGMPDVELVGVADANPDQARAIAAKLGTTPFDHFAPLLTRVDAVSVVTPTVHHHEVAAAFLRAGVPVLVEKPVCRTVAEADELIALAAEVGVPFQVGHIERFNPAFEELVKRPIRPKFIEAERHGPFTGRSVDIGAVLDLMIHDLDLLLSLVGSPVRQVSAVGAAVFGGHEDMVNARLEFENGCVAHVTASRITKLPKRRLRIWAPEGYAGIDFVTRKLALVQRSEELRRNGLRVEHLDAAAKARLKDEVFGRYLQVLNLDGDRKGDQLTAELKHFLDCVRTGNTPRVSGSDGRDALELAERVLAALRAHAWNGSADGPLGAAGLPEPAGFLFTPAQIARPEAA